MRCSHVNAPVARDLVKGAHLMHAGAVPEGGQPGGNVPNKSFTQERLATAHRIHQYDLPKRLSKYIYLS